MKRLLLATAGLLLLALSPAHAAVCPTPIIPDGQAASQSWQINAQAVLEKICANLDTLVAGGSGAGPGDVNLKQVGGATVSTGTGAQGAASPRVTVAVDSATVAGSAAIPAGSAIIGKVGLDQTTPGTTNLVALGAATTGGCTPYHLLSAANTNPTLVKTGATTLCSLSVINTTGTIYYLKLYNQVAAPSTCATDAANVVQNFPIPASASGAGVAPPLGPFGVAFSTGLAFCLTSGQADNDVASAQTGININLAYK